MGLAAREPEIDKPGFRRPLRGNGVEIGTLKTLVATLREQQTEQWVKDANLGRY